jgi:hypothetical protein
MELGGQHHIPAAFKRERTQELTEGTDVLESAYSECP